MLDPPPCFTKLQLTLLLPFSSAQAAKRVQRTRGSHWWRKEALPSAHGVAQSCPPRKNRRQGLCEGSP